MTSLTCDGCRWHSKDPEPGPWVNDDGSLRDDLCRHPQVTKNTGFDEVPIFNSRCRHYKPKEAVE